MPELTAEVAKAAGASPEAAGFASAYASELIASKITGLPMRGKSVVAMASQVAQDPDKSVESQQPPNNAEALPAQS